MPLCQPWRVSASGRSAPHLFTLNRDRALKLEIKLNGGALALAVAVLLLAGCGYYGWQTFQSGLALREQTKWIKAIATGDDASELNIPRGDRYGVALMAQMAKTSGLAESDWQTFENEATNQLRNGALYMAGSVLLAGLAIERLFRKSLSRRRPPAATALSGGIEPASNDRQQDS